jgi:hypothetical protein
MVLWYAILFVLVVKEVAIHIATLVIFFNVKTQTMDCEMGKILVTLL